jgi:hypothetical protein
VAAGAFGPHRLGHLRAVNPTLILTLIRNAGRRQERLDPIDWATYEPYLWANEAAYCRRSAVLFGALTRLSASPPQARPRPSRLASMGASCQCMQCARVARATVALRLGTPSGAPRICSVLGA